jgi:hypothetical protein
MESRFVEDNLDWLDLDGGDAASTPDGTSIENLSVESEDEEEN